MGLVNYLVKRAKVVVKIVETIDQVAKTMRQMFVEFNQAMINNGKDINHLRLRVWDLERTSVPITHKRLRSLRMFRIRNRIN